jgi:hypothetical protein
MVEAVAFGAGVIAFIQLADRVITVSSAYIEAFKARGSPPNTLRLINSEVSSLRPVLELLDADGAGKGSKPSTADQADDSLDGSRCSYAVHDADAKEASKWLDNGKTKGLADANKHLDLPLPGCRRCIVQLAELFPDPSAEESHPMTGSRAGRSKKRLRLGVDLVAILAWPFREPKAQKLFADLLQYKSSLILSTRAQARYVSLAFPRGAASKVLSSREATLAWASRGRHRVTCCLKLTQLPLFHIIQVTCSLRHVESFLLRLMEPLAPLSLLESLIHFRSMWMSACNVLR